MSEDFRALLREWDTFALLVSTAGATLAGLMFVGLSLGERMIRGRDGVPLLRAYTDPTLLCFVLSLATGALLLIPDLNAVTFGALMLLVGALSFAYSLRILRQMRREGQTTTTWDASDWLWFVLIPLLCALLLAGAGALALRGEGRAALAVTGAVLLVLLVMGIRNAWDLVAYAVAHLPAPDGED